MKIIKRGGRKVEFDRNKIKNAISKVFAEFENRSDEYYKGIREKAAEQLTEKIVQKIKNDYDEPHVEEIQNEVENMLIKHDYIEVAKAYIRYRENHTKKRKEWLKKELPMSIWTRKYQYKNESFEGFLSRVTNGNQKAKKLIKDKKFCPAGRILANRGLQKDGRKVTYSNCFTEGHKVLTKRGLINIENVKVGDKVLTHKDRWKPVNEVMCKRYSGKMVDLKTKYGLGSIKCTIDHEFLTNDGWKEAGDLRQYSNGHASRNGKYYDALKLINVEDNEINKDIDLFDFIEDNDFETNLETENGKINTQSSHELGNGAIVDRKSNPINRFVKLDEDLLYLIGRWLGDGCISSRKDQQLSIVQITFNLKEEKQAIRCKNIIEDKFGIKVNVNKNLDQNTLNLRFDSIILAHLINNIFNRGVENKTIPYELLSSKSKPLLLGFLDADGCFTKRGSVAVCIKNEELADKIKLLSYLCNIPCKKSLEKQPYKNDGKEYYIYKLYYPKLVGVKELKDNLDKVYEDSRLEKEYKVNSVDIKNIEGSYFSKLEKKEIYKDNVRVYNISVEDDHSYTVNGVVVHNCYVITPPDDDLKSINESTYKLERTFSYGGLQ